MAELTGRGSVSVPCRRFRRATQLLAVAWLRWRIFVNGMFRKRPKGTRQVVGLVFAILLRIDRLAHARADRGRSGCGQRIPCVDGDLRGPPAKPRVAAAGHRAALAICEHQRPQHRRRNSELRSCVAGALSSALRPLFCVALAARPDDAQHHRGLPGSAGRRGGNRHRQIRRWRCPRCW